MSPYFVAFGVISIYVFIFLLFVIYYRGRRKKYREEEKMGEHPETTLKLQELVEEGVLEEINPEEVVISEEFLGYLEKGVATINRLEMEGVELPENKTRGVALFAYMGFMGETTEEDLPIKVSLITTVIELLRDNRLEEWVMKTRIRSLK